MTLFIQRKTHPASGRRGGKKEIEIKTYHRAAKRERRSNGGKGYAAKTWGGAVSPRRIAISRTKELQP